MTNLLEPISYLIIAFAFFISLRFSYSKKIQVLFLSSLLATLLMSTASYDVFIQKNNILKYDWLLLLTACAVSIYFYLSFNSTFKRIFTLVVMALSILNFIQRNYISHTGSNFDSIGFPLFSLSVIIMVFMYFNQMLNNVSSEPILLNFDFWIIAAFLIYHLGSVIISLTLYGVAKEIINFQDSLTVTNLWGGHNVVLFLSSICILVGALWINYQKK